jgi:uncharacterized repeat protein (TIGR02543 family)
MTAMRKGKIPIMNLRLNNYPPSRPVTSYTENSPGGGGAFPRLSALLTLFLVVLTLALTSLLPTSLFAATIDVSVPTKVLWAAFGSDSGTVSSPLYHIRNNSDSIDLKVTLNSFTAKDTPANTFIDPSLSLEMTSPVSHMGNVTNLFARTNHTTPFTNTLAHNNTWDFGIEGEYSAPIGAKNYQPRYDMVFSFDIKRVQVTFDSQGGSAVSPINVIPGETYGTLTTPSRPGYTFKGWWTTPSTGGSEVSASITVTSDHTLYARWELKGLVFTVSVAAGEGFIIPTSGYSAAAYDWDIDWGDNSELQPASGTSSTNGAANAGISKSDPYTSAGTYTIVITPHSSSTFGWARAFGFASGTTLASASANKAKVREVLAIPVKGFLQSETQTGDNFMRNVWYGCTNLESVAFNDSFTYPVTSLGTYFLDSTWRGCTSLATAAVPNTADWEVTSLGGYFLQYTWSSCTSLATAAVPNTTKWRPTTIDTSFLDNTWQNCTSLTTAVVPDTADWEVTSIGTYFLHRTWQSCVQLTNKAAVPDTADWEVTSIGTYFLYYTWQGCSSLTTAVVPTTTKWRPTTISNNFLGYTWNNCTSLTTATVPDTADWEITSLGTYFLYLTWSGCRQLGTAAVPDTTKWCPTTIGNYFFNSTWNGCTSLTEAAVPNTADWEITGSTGYDFFNAAWQDCTSLTVAAVPNTTNWHPTTIGTNFLIYAWRRCTSLITATAPDTTNWTPTTLSTHFLDNTWNNCTSLLDISTITLGVGLKSVSTLYTGTSNFYQTFALGSATVPPNPLPATYGDQPKFTDGTDISEGTIPGTTSRQTFRNRSGMTDYGSLSSNWK